MKKGDRICIKGLQNRKDLNGQLATLLDWCDDLGRWGAQCDSGERVRIKPDNIGSLKKHTKKRRGWEKRKESFEPLMAETLRSMVRGGGPGRPDVMPYGVGHGQVSRMLLEAAIPLFLKVYSNAPPEAELVACVVEIIGKEGDSLSCFSSH